MDALETYEALRAACRRPAPFSVGTPADLWTEPHTAAKMLAFHLDAEVNAASRRHADIDRCVAWLAREHDLAAGRRVLDLGCGPGLYTTRLARLGARVTGVDFSASSLAHARAAAAAEGLTVDYQQADYHGWESDERFDLITLIMCDFCVFSPRQRIAMLERFRRHLAPGGAVVFDAYTLAALARRAETTRLESLPADNFWSAEPCVVLHRLLRYERERVTLDHYTLVESGRCRAVRVWHQYHDPRELVDELAAHGVLVEHLLGDLTGAEFDPEADEFAVVARLA